MLSVISSLFLSVISLNSIALPPPEYDHPFSGRLIVEQLSIRDIEYKCNNAWDRRFLSPVYACSWHGPDNLNPGHDWCHMIIPRMNTPNWTTDDEIAVIRIETANCNGWHDTEVRDYSNE